MRKPVTRRYTPRKVTFFRWDTVDYLRSESDRRMYLQVWLETPDATTEEIRQAIADIDRSRRGRPTRYKKPGMEPGKG